MQKPSDPLKQTGPIWSQVLVALHHAKRSVSLEELSKQCEQEEINVMNALTFLHVQGWVECTSDGLKWACVPEARVIVESIERSAARAL